ncbi:uncharacterized protein LOC142563503 [Dermacentor variabilis]|uniref:uncharacterized protein LOC142563503 n=1 Tax=Dermacentor variabilis TaxID=34621 RepID=UPI003F5C743F
MTERHNAIVARIRKAALGRFTVTAENQVVGTTPHKPELVLARGEEALILDVCCPFENRLQAFQDAWKAKEEKYAPAHRILTCPEEGLYDRAKRMVMEVPFSGPSVQYGVAMEPKARVAFQKEHEVTVAEFGLVVCPEEPWLACSPDGIFRDKYVETILLEIKCPYSRRNTTLKNKPLLNYLCGDQVISLRRSHQYFTQVQICMHVLGLDVRHLYVYSSADMLMIPVKKDSDFLLPAVPKLRRFYF